VDTVTVGTVHVKVDLSALQKAGANAQARVDRAVVQAASLVQREAKKNVKRLFGHGGNQAARMKRGTQMRAANRKARRKGQKAPHSEADIQATRTAKHLGPSIILKHTPGSLKAVVGPTAIYGRIREKGGDIYPRRKKFLSWIDPDSGERIFARHVHQEGKPYLAPALAKNRGRIEAIIRKAAEDIAREGNGKGGGGGADSGSEGNPE
jgi:hypothetical protein